MLTRVRENWLNHLRLGLATLVLFSHSVPLTYGKGAEAGHEWVMRLTQRQMTGGDVAVQLFFLLSGVLVTKSWLRDRHVPAYLSRRWRRIFPAFVCAYLFAVFVAPVLVPRDLPAIRDVLDHFHPLVHAFMIGTLHVPFLGVFNGLPYPRAANASAWTLPFEAWCYLFVPFLAGMRAFRYRGLMVALWLGAVVLVALGLPRPANWPLALHYLVGPLESWPHLLACFFGGVVISLYRRKLPWGPVVRWAALAVLIATVLLGRGLVVAFPVCSGLLLWDALSASTGRAPGRGTDLSYGVYLYAFPIQ
jgi:peptidoglycan/LPS O-acetylase OafA/YrhL